MENDPHRKSSLQLGEALFLAQERHEDWAEAMVSDIFSPHLCAPGNPHPAPQDDNWKGDIEYDDFLSNFS